MEEFNKKVINGRNGSWVEYFGRAFPRNMVFTTDKIIDEETGMPIFRVIQQGGNRYVSWEFIGLTAEAERDRMFKDLTEFLLSFGGREKKKREKVKIYYDSGEAYILFDGHLVEVSADSMDDAPIMAGLTAGYCFDFGEYTYTYSSEKKAVNKRFKLRRKYRLAQEQIKEEQQ